MSEKSCFLDREKSLFRQFPGQFPPAAFSSDYGVDKYTPRHLSSSSYKALRFISQFILTTSQSLAFFCFQGRAAFHFYTIT